MPRIYTSSPNTEYDGTEEPDTSLDDEVESIETFNVFEECDEFDDHDDY